MVAVIVLVMATVWTFQPAGAAVLDGFSMSYLGSTQADGNTTFSYKLNGPEGGAVSHVVIGTCLGATALATSPSGATYGPDPTTGVTGYKWETGFGNDGPPSGTVFTLTFAGLLSDGGSASVAMKKGSGEGSVIVTTLAGPSCAPAPAPAKLTVVKQVAGDDAQGFTFVPSANLPGGSFVLGDDGAGPLPASKEFSGLAAGTYDVTESATDGWDLESVSCLKGDSPVGTVAGAKATVTLAAGDEVTCTFTNKKRAEHGVAKLVVLKHVAGGSPQDFTFVPSDNVPGGSFVLDDDADPTYHELKLFMLAPGTYEVTESPTPGWTLSSLSCKRFALDGLGESVGTISGSKATVTLAAGDHVICTFVNAPVTTPPPEVGGTVVVRPGIDVVKQGPALAHVGDTVTYRFVVTSTTEVPLTSVAVTDPRCDGVPVLVGQTGDLDAALEQGEAWTFGCSHVVQAGDPDPLPNTATATGVGNGITVSDVDDHLVDIIHPAIALDKKASVPTGEPGDPLTFTYDVTNTGDVDLVDVVVTDDKLGVIGEIPLLVPGQTVQLSKATTFSSGDVTNVGTAEGTDPLGLVVDADDEVTVSVVLAEEIVRPAPPAVAPQELPRTGADSQRLALLGALSIAAGLVLVGSGALVRGRR